MSMRLPSVAKTSTMGSLRESKRGRSGWPGQTGSELPPCRKSSLHLAQVWTCQNIIGSPEKRDEAHARHQQEESLCADLIWRHRVVLLLLFLIVVLVIILVIVLVRDRAVHLPDRVVVLDCAVREARHQLQDRSGRQA